MNECILTAVFHLQQNTLQSSYEMSVYLPKLNSGNHTNIIIYMDGITGWLVITYEYIHSHKSLTKSWKNTTDQNSITYSWIYPLTLSNKATFDKKKTTLGQREWHKWKAGMNSFPLHITHWSLPKIYNYNSLKTEGKIKTLLFKYLCAHMYISCFYRHVLI